MNFTKMQGTGNDFIVIEDLENKFLGKESDLAKKICNRRFGIGADGILFVRKNENMFEMVIINSDGSYASMCGNGLRCFGMYLFKEKGLPPKFDVLTGDGIKKIMIENDLVKIDMGCANFLPESYFGDFEDEVIDKEIKINEKTYKITSMNLGVPHTIIFEKFKNIDIEKEGSSIERFEKFKKGTNVNFVEIQDRRKIYVKTFERGCGRTLACGTGSCASVYAGKILGLLENEVEVVTDGGNLFMQIEGEEIYMRAKAEIVFKGEI